MHYWFYKLNKYLRPSIDTTTIINIEQFDGSQFFLFVISDKTLEFNSAPLKKKNSTVVVQYYFFGDGVVKMF